MCCNTIYYVSEHIILSVTEMGPIDFIFRPHKWNVMIVIFHNLYFEFKKFD